MNTLQAYAGVARAPFLLLPPTLIASGAAAAAWDGHFSWLHSVVALIGLTALHIAVDAFNEWSDMRTGIDLNTQRTPFSGGSGTLPAGGMTLRAALVYGVVCAVIGLGIGVWFVTQIGAVLVPLLIVGGICVVFYTDILARLWIGEIAAGFGLGMGPVLGAALVQDGGWSPAAMAASVPAFFMTFNLLFLNEFPDEQADRDGGRRNIVLLLGRRRAALVYAAAGIATPLAIVVSVIQGWLPTPALIGVLPSLLLVKPLAWALGDASEPVPIPAMGANVAWNLATNSLLAIGLVVAILIRV